MQQSLPILIISLVILSFGCNSQKESDSSGKDVPYIIDFEQCMATEQPMKISDIADTVEYLELKTPKDIIITRIRNIILIENFLIIHSRDGVFKFTKKGEFVTQIGHTGQGPREYTLIVGIDIDPIKKEIIMADVAAQVLFYDLDGNFLRREKWGLLFRIGLSDSILWVSELATQEDRYIAFALNQKGDTIASIPNPHYGMKSKDEGTGVALPAKLKSFYHYKGGLYLKGKEVNDTIYQLSGSKSTPYAFFNMGKYKLPLKYEAWYSWDDHNKYGSSYWGVPYIAEEERYLFLTALRCAPIDENKYVHNEENYRYIAYNKEKRKGFIIKSEKGTRITDNILGGPPIWPHWITNDHYINVVEWYDLSEELKKGQYTLAPALKEQFAGFGYSTNQLIVLCKRKK